MRESIAKHVTKNDSQDVCFNGYPITDTTDQWSPIFEYQHVYLIFHPQVHVLRPRGANMCCIYTTGAPHGL